MEENYSVQNKVYDKNNGKWSNNVVCQKDNYRDAETEYHKEIARLNPVDGYEFAAVIMLDTFGHATSWFRDSRPVPVPPTPEPGEG